jgi:hypothetical protein
MPAEGGENKKRAFGFEAPDKKLKRKFSSLDHREDPGRFG